MPLVTFSAGAVIKSADVNANFALCVLTDTSRTISVTHTWTASQTFSNGLSSAGTITLTATASKILPGVTSLSLRNNADSADNVLISDAGAVTVRAGLTVASGGITVSSGSTALQAVSAAGTVTSTLASGQIFTNVSGTTGSLYHRYSNTSGALDFGITGSTGGALFTGDTAYSAVFGTQVAKSLHLGTSGVVRLTIDSVGIVTLAGGNLTFGAAVSKILPGATSFSHRNTADSADNLLITDAGVVTLRNTLNGVKQLKSAGTAPGIALGSASGSGGAPAATFAGTATDMAGLVQVTTGSGAVGTGTMVTVTFATAYAAAPIIAITPSNTNAAGKAAQIYASATTTAFTIEATVAPAISTAYSWYYTIIAT